MKQKKERNYITIKRKILVCVLSLAFTCEKEFSLREKCKKPLKIKIAKHILTIIFNSVSFKTLQVFMSSLKTEIRQVP